MNSLVDTSFSLFYLILFFCLLNALFFCPSSVTRVSYRYHIALSPLDGTVYISDPESHQILKIRDPNDFSDPDHNWTPAVGSGERCLPGDEAHCGDGALARDAKLAYPKGISFFPLSFLSYGSDSLCNVATLFFAIRTYAKVLIS